ncbi:MAG: hypothetical protein C0409_15490, partial [Novosphingobium sp.]|nr:hypothetical protein [Novosphingobium sp.]
MSVTASLLALAAALTSGEPAGSVAPVQPGSTASPSGAPQMGAPVSTDDLLLLVVQLDRMTISEALTAYGDPQDPLLPLGELSRLLELPLEVDVSNGVVSGRIGESQRPITIDLRSGQA